MIVAGVDIGSVAAKVVLFSDKILAAQVLKTGADCNKAAQNALELALKQANLTRQDVGYIVSTGYGRRAIDFGDTTVTEITANARGASYLGSSKGQVRTIINVGGQDSKVIVLDEKGTISNFSMNDKCAAGTGRFLDVISKALEEDLDSFSKLSLKSENPATINSTCTVFAESEVISLVAQKYLKQDIIAGIHKSVAKRLADMAQAAGAKDVIFFDGGGAMNVGLKAMLEKELGKEVYVWSYPQFTVALGAALIGLKKMNNG